MMLLRFFQEHVSAQKEMIPDFVKLVSKNLSCTEQTYMLNLSCYTKIKFRRSDKMKMPILYMNDKTILSALI